MKKLKELLNSRLPKKDLALVPSSFDIIGDKIIFVHFPSELQKKQKIIANTILEYFPHISSVFKKSRQYGGRFRTAKLTWVAGSKSKETIHRENGVSLRLDIEKVYFSPRLATERKRIFQQVKAEEEILCLFSGCGAYPIAIARNASPKKIYAIELNPLAHYYAIENIQINKVEDKIMLRKGNVKNLLPRLRNKFDRVLMPLPKESEHFLEITLRKIKKNGKIHFYCFGDNTQVKSMGEKIKEKCREQKKSCRILKITRCGQASPKTYRWCIDFKVSY